MLDVRPFVVRDAFLCDALFVVLIIALQLVSRHLDLDSDDAGSLRQTGDKVGASYDVHSETYARLIGNVTDVLDDRRDQFTLFWEPTLNFARRLLQINQRAPRD